MSARNGDHLFVYGTLLSDAGHPMGELLRDKARRVGRGSIQARLYIIEEVDAEGVNRYPAALPSADAADRVHGEIFELTDAAPLIAALDDFEACSPRWPEPYEFLLRRVEVTREEGGTAPAFSYLYTWDVSAARHVPSGRFTEGLAGAR